MNYVSKYTDFLKTKAEVQKPLRIVCDASNGSTSIVLQELSGIKNLELILINTETSGDFPAHGPNPLENGATDDLSKKVLEAKADFGAVFDADGDRAFFVDDAGKVIASYISAAILFKSLPAPFVTDELVYMSLTSSGIVGAKDIYPTPVGSIFIKEGMKKNDAIIGAEYSGHFYFKDFFGLDSGILTMIKMANTLSAQNKKLSELHAALSIQNTDMQSLKLKNAKWPEIKDEIKKQTANFAKEYFERDGLTFTIEKGWINVRASNTEPLVRISIGTNSETETTNAMSEIIKIITTFDERTS